MNPVCESEIREPVPTFGRGFSTRRQILFAACICAGASAFVFTVNPTHHPIYPQCLLYNTTGVFCAGCGATRAVYALLHGRLLDAAHDNLLLVIALPLLAYVGGSYLLKAWKLNAWPAVFVNNRTLIWRGVGALALMLGFMVLRNMPGWPFELLRPLSG